jgi:multiple sugar transport system substrate-binding protein
MKRSWIVLLALFVVSVFVAAGVLAQESDLSGTVRVLTWESGENLQYWEQVESGFETAHPGVDVQVESVPQNSGTVLLAQFASNSAPDVFQTGDGDAARFAALGAVENLDSYISGENGFDMAELVPGVAAFGQMQGSTYYLTKDYSPLVLYYNKDMFDEAGVAYPDADWTWDDFLAAAKTLTIDGNGNNADSPDFDSANIQRWGVWLPNSWGDTSWERGILPIIFQGGGSQVSEDGTTTTGYMNSEENIAALQWYADLFDVHHVAPTRADYASFSGVDLFAQQQVAMMWTGIWPLNAYRTGDSALTFNFGTNVLPAGPAGSGNALCWAGFGMYSGGQNKDAAWEFLKYIGVGEGAEVFATYALTDVVRVIEAQGLDTDEYTSSVIAGLDTVQPIPETKTQHWAECGNKFFVQEIATVLDGDAQVQAAMDNAASLSDACLAEKAAEASS